METKQHHVLYIEDHDDTRELITLILTRRNYRVTTGSNMVDALRLAGEQHFDLYMLDSWLPDGSGVDVCTKLRELNPEIPVMFLSGAAYELDKETAINSGAQAYFIKPADLDVLCDEVGKLIDLFTRKPERAEGSAIRSSNLRESPKDTTGVALLSKFKC
jgi:DNA-binding response OmpR family regulator